MIIIEEVKLMKIRIEVVQELINNKCIFKHMGTKDMLADLLK